LFKHVALKCTYNDGGQGDYVGFAGTCSNATIKHNIEANRVWCNQSECRAFYERGFKGKPPVDPCYESSLFRTWCFGAGWYHNGKKAGTPIIMHGTAPGKITVLTTRFPGDDESARKIIGFFKIASKRTADGQETFLHADPHYRVRLPLEEARELYFWDYYNRQEKPFWGTGLYRYLEDEDVYKILTDIRATIRNEPIKLVIDKLLSEDFANVASAPVSTRRHQNRVSIARKYGSFGEGEEHKKLKHWVAQNPSSIGINGVTKVQVEYTFPSGDTVDILFHCSNGRDVVVEIETVDPLPGCYQALKYRTLRCAERNLPIDSNKVDAYVVAWSFPKLVHDFCKTYGIRTVTKKL
jgi:hypothetical protein